MKIIKNLLIELKMEVIGPKHVLTIINFSSIISFFLFLFIKILLLYKIDQKNWEVKLII